MRDAHESSDRLKVAISVARALSRSQTVEEAGAHLIEILCREAGFRGGALWLLDEEAGELRCRALWPEGDDPRRDPVLLRSAGSEQDGLGRSFTMPVLDEGAAVGTFELYPSKQGGPCARSLSSIGELAAEIGSTLRRLDRESQAVAASQALSRLIAEGTAAVFVFDREARLRAYGGCAAEAFGVDPIWLEDRPVFERLPPTHPLCANLARALAGERVSDRLDLRGPQRAYEHHYLPRAAKGRVDGVLGLAIRVSVQKGGPRSERGTDRARARVVAARLLVSRLLSFESSRRPKRPDNEHRLELLADAKRDLCLAERALSGGCCWTGSTRRRPVSANDCGPIPIPIAREDSGGGSIPS